MENIVIERAHNNHCPICDRDLSDGKTPTVVETYNNKKIMLCDGHHRPRNAS